MTIVTVNTRLARRLRRELDREREGAGTQFWESPDILPWRAWLKRLWEDLVYSGRENRVLLSASQESILWETVIRGREEDLLNPEGTAQAAAQAWTLFHSWRLPRVLAAFDEVPDTAAWFAWMQAFQLLLKTRGFITEAELPEVLLKKGFERPDAHAGFDEMNPVERELFQDCEEWPLEYPVTSTRRRCNLADPPEELRAAARWSRQVLEINPAARIGVVFPDLQAKRAAVSRIFSEVLGSKEAFHISAPVPLADVPIVRAAILALKHHSGLSLPEAGEMLRSPYLHNTLQDGARQDLAVRRRGASMVMIRNREAFPATQRPGGWSNTFSLLAASSGWPGARGLNSYEYQAAESWKELLSEFARLDAVLGDLNFDAALDRLEELAKHTGFGAEEEDEPVQIVGILESVGARFDALWVGGLDDTAWPPPPRPHPFLPLKLQRKAGIPLSSVDLQFELAKRMTSRLLRSADKVVCSYPAGDGEASLRPSPFLVQMAEWQPPAPPEPDLAATLEVLEDDVAPPLGEDRFVKGGMSVIADQSACPFKAFARHRLGARSLDEVEPGLTAIERGNVTHQALQTIWETLRSRQRLLDIDVDSLRELVRESVERALQERLGEASRYLTNTQALEVRRLSGLLLEWLEMEKERPNFETWQLEVRQRHTLGGLELEIKADRVDRYDDGSLAILDYKTGNSSEAKHWDTDRPKAPQLPIYCTTMTDPVSTVAFAQLATGELALKGFSERGDSELKAGKGYTLHEQIDNWRKILHALGEEFLEGDSRVSPADGACQFCDLKGLCRVAETGKESSGG
jgi:ATP-dependent helicase/nuclease subunit B